MGADPISGIGHKITQIPGRFGRLPESSCPSFVRVNPKHFGVGPQAHTFLYRKGDILFPRKEESGVSYQSPFELVLKRKEKRRSHKKKGS